MNIYRRLVILLLIFAVFFLFTGEVASARTKTIAKAKGKTEVTEAAPKISESVIYALASGDLNAAILAMREEKSSPKLLYLIREVTRITNFEISPKPAKGDAHKVYQNIGTGYHNLYLFLKSNGINQKSYSDEATKYYKKARSSGTMLHKTDCDVLQAALLAASGDREKSKKIFSKIDESSMRGDFESMEYVAAYHSAAGNSEEAIAALDAAHRLNPDATLTWLNVGDDFHGIEDDPQFKALLVTWKAAKVGKKLTLSVPKSEEPRFEITDDTGIFRPQKAMPHYDLKKAKKSKTASKKAALAGKKTKTPAVKKSKTHK